MVNNKLDVKCPACKATTENTYAIKCCKCAKWNHIRCVNLTRARLNFYEKEMKDPVGQRWSCQLCGDDKRSEVEVVKRPSMGAVAVNASTNSPALKKKESEKEYTLKDVMEKLEVIDDKYTNLLQKYEEQMIINENLLLEIEKLKEKVTKLESEEPVAPSGHAAEAIHELKDRDYKRKNLIVFGLKELDSEEAEERKAHDMGAISTMLESNFTEVSRDKLRVYRIGRREQGKVRPVRVIMASETDVRKVIKHASNIKNSPQYLGLGFSTDKTKQQLQEYKLIKEELKNRVDKGGENLCIRYIRGKPKIVLVKN